MYESEHAPAQAPDPAGLCVVVQELRRVPGAFGLSRREETALRGGSLIEAIPVRAGDR